MQHQSSQVNIFPDPQVYFYSGWWLGVWSMNFMTFHIPGLVKIQKVIENGDL